MARCADVPWQPLTVHDLREADANAFDAHVAYARAPRSCGACARPLAGVAAGSDPRAGWRGAPSVDFTLIDYASLQLLLAEWRRRYDDPQWQPAPLDATFRASSMKPMPARAPIMRVTRRGGSRASTICPRGPICRWCPRVPTRGRASRTAMRGSIARNGCAGQLREPFRAERGKRRAGRVRRSRRPLEPVARVLPEPDGAEPSARASAHRRGARRFHRIEPACCRRNKGAISSSVRARSARACSTTSTIAFTGVDVMRTRAAAARMRR